ncbi:MAG: HAD-IIB family hydrolase [Phycisphaerales bacterium]
MAVVRYKLLAIDLDGTLVDHHGHVSPANLRALRAAREAGIMVVVCTGRALIESMQVIRAIEQRDPVIVAGGAMVSCPDTGLTLERFALDQSLTSDIVSHLTARGHAALVLKDPHAAGYDYLVVSERGIEAVDASSRWWFKNMGARLRCVARLEDDEHPEHSVRIGAYAANTPVDELAAELRTRFGGVAMLQHFSGVMLPAERKLAGIESVHIVELFHAQADKWQALDRLAMRLGIPRTETAAIGDQLNDLSMITHAGLGIAMGNGHERVKAAARRTTLSVDEDGVAHAIGMILEGAW